MVSESQKRANRKWLAENRVQVVVNLYRDRDADILEYILAKKDRSKYIADLIRDDMAAGSR